LELQSNIAAKAGIQLYIKREDLNHPCISGNKWWKLKYNLEHVLDKGYSGVLTFGGAFSNHLYATAAATNELGLSSIGMVRGEETLPLNPTLSFAKAMGMDLHYIDRATYRRKNESEFTQSLRNEFEDFYLIPEGGTNDLAIKGCEEWAAELNKNIDFEYLCLPVGTGGTISGMINVLKEKKIIGFSSLKGGSFLIDEIQPWLTHQIDNWRIETSYHFGGYGKSTDELSNFILEFETRYHIPLDPIYTGKMMFGVFDLIQRSAFPSGSKILVLHTGGLQGRSQPNF